MRAARRLFPFVIQIVFLLLFTVSNGLSSFAQPVVVWDKTLGGEDYEEMEGLLPLPDGILVGGSARSNLSFGDPADLSWNILIF